MIRRFRPDKAVDSAVDVAPVAEAAVVAEVLVEAERQQPRLARVVKQAPKLQPKVARAAVAVVVEAAEVAAASDLAADAVRRSIPANTM